MLKEPPLNLQETAYPFLPGQCLPQAVLAVVDIRVVYTLPAKRLPIGSESGVGLGLELLSISAQNATVRVTVLGSATEHSIPVYNIAKQSWPQQDTFVLVYSEEEQLLTWAAADASLAPKINLRCLSLSQTAPRISVADAQSQMIISRAQELGFYPSTAKGQGQELRLGLSWNVSAMPPKNPEFRGALSINGIQGNVSFAHSADVEMSWGSGGAIGLRGVPWEGNK